MYFVLKRTSDGQFMWEIKAGNHETVAVSERYTTKQAAMKTIDSIKSNGINNNTPVKNLTEA